MWPPKMASMATLSRTLEKGKLMWLPKMVNVVTLSRTFEKAETDVFSKKGTFSMTHKKVETETFFLLLANLKWMSNPMMAFFEMLSSNLKLCR
jgi:hypothetical protein